jgi:hypothetical protein
VNSDFVKPIAQLLDLALRIPTLIYCKCAVLVDISWSTIAENSINGAKFQILCKLSTLASLLINTRNKYKIQ